MTSAAAHTAGRPPSVACPACGYEIAGSAPEVGACTECGARYNRRALLARRRTLEDLVLSMIAWGLAAAMIARLLGSVVQYLPRDASGGAADPASATELLQLAPILVTAAAICVGAFCTTLWPWRRLWPMLVAASLAMVSLHAVAALKHPTWGRDYPLLLQPFAWRDMWAATVLPGLFAVAAAVVCRRFAERIGSKALRGAAIACVCAGLAAAVFDLSGAAHQSYIRQRQTITLAPGQRVVPTPAFTQPPFALSGQATESLRLVGELGLLAAWSGTALLAFFTRALVRADRQGV
jgi:hypothetical protein